MLISVGIVTSLFVWCLAKVLGGKKPPEHLAHVEPVGVDEVKKR